MAPNRLIPGLALAALATALAAGYAASRLQPPSFHGTFVPAGEPAEFTLEAADRGPVRLSDFRGRPVLLFFGYTSCPDVCPLTLAKLDDAIERLGERRRDVQVVLVTVDPKVDTPRRLREYVQRFDLGFLGLGGERAELAEVARSFGAWGGEPQDAPVPSGGAGHEAHAGSGEGDPPTATARMMIPHTSHVFGIDRDGRLRLLWRPEFTADQIAEDVRGLFRL